MGGQMVESVIGEDQEFVMHLEMGSQWRFLRTG